MQSSPRSSSPKSGPGRHTSSTKRDGANEDSSQQFRHCTVFLVTDNDMQTSLFTVCASELAVIREANFTNRFGGGRRSFTSRNHYAGRDQDGGQGASTGAATANQDKTEGGAPTQVLQRPKGAKAKPVLCEDRPNAQSVLTQRCQHRGRAQTTSSQLMKKEWLDRTSEK